MMGQMRLLDNRETSAGVVAGVGGGMPCRRGTLEWFELGGRRTDSVPAMFVTEARGAFADPYSLGNIGTTLLEPFRIVFDYPGGRIAFVAR